MEISTLLTTIGLTKTESAVYIDLLQYGTQTISSISRTSKMHRPAIYAALPTLKEKGLINERRVGKLIHYAAEHPEQLRSLLTPVHEQLDTVIPELAEMQNKKTPTVRRLDGMIGVHAVFNDIVNTLNKGDTFYRYSSVRHNDYEKVGQPKDYIKRRDAKKIERLVIANEEYLKSRKPSLEEAIRIVPDDFLPFDSDVAQIIYGDKIAFIDYNQPVATIIENPTLAQFQKDIFMMLFKKLER